jgi:hypothetical protein
LRVGDKVGFSVYRSAGKLHGFEPVLLDINRHREPIRELPRLRFGTWPRHHGEPDAGLIVRREVGGICP